MTAAIALGIAALVSVTSAAILGSGGLQRWEA